MVPELSKDQRLLLRRGARIQAAYDAWKAAGSPYTSAWLDNFIAEHNAMCDEFDRVKDAGEAIVLHPVAWSLHYRRARASLLGRGDAYWAAHMSPRDPALEQVLANEAVPVPQGAGEDESDREDAPRESKWWKFKDPESRTAVDTDGDTGGARSPVAPFEIAADRRGGTTPAPAVLSLVARSTSVLATRGDKHDPLASSQAAGDTCASSRAHAVPPSPSLPGSHVTHGTDSSTPVPPHGYTRGLSSRVRDQDQNYSLSPDTNTGPTRVRQLLDRILRGKRQIESETREAVVLGRTSVTPARAPRQHPLSTAKRVSFCLPDQPEPDTPREAIDNFASVVPQKRKHAGLRDDVHTRDGPRTTSSRRSRSGSADVGSEDTSGAFAKRRKVLDFARPAGGAVENVDEAEESDEADEAEADDEWESGTGHRMVTRRAAGKTTSTPPSREIIPEEAQPKKPVTRTRIWRPLRPFTPSELQFITHASNVKVVSCQKCTDDGIRCVPTTIGRSCKGCRNRKKCTHVASGNRGGSLRLTPSHFWESLLRNAARPIPPLPPVPYLFPLHEVDKLGIDHSVLISKLRYPKNLAEAETFLDADEFAGLATSASESQSTPMDVDSDRPVKRLPRRRKRASPSDSVIVIPPRSPRTSASDSGETSRALAVLQDEVRNLRLQVSEQQKITTAHGQRLDTHGQRLDTHGLHIDQIRKALPEIATGVANVVQSHRRMEQETDRISESHRRIEKEVADSWDIMQGTAAAMQSLLEKFARMSSS